MSLSRSTFQFWAHGVRLYIAIAILLFTIDSIWWAHASYGSTVLFPTRLEELYAWVALGLIIVAVSIGPVCSIWPKIPGKQMLFDARRLIGIAGAWFSSLHILIAYGSLFKFANPFSLPSSYQRAFAIGAIAGLILLAMAFTSFDKAFRDMGKWWFRLHRLVYAAIILSLLHAFLIGAHATYLPALIVLTISAIFVLGLHIYIAFFDKKPASPWRIITLPAISLVLVLTLVFGYNQKHGEFMKSPNPGSNMQDMHSMKNMEGPPN